MDNTERPGEIINRELYMITENEIQKKEVQVKAGRLTRIF
jgi:hypothetical protein